MSLNPKSKRQLKSLMAYLSPNLSVTVENLLLRMGSRRLPVLTFSSRSGNTVDKLKHFYPKKFLLYLT